MWGCGEGQQFISATFTVHCASASSVLYYAHYTSPTLYTIHHLLCTLYTTYSVHCTPPPMFTIHPIQYTANCIVEEDQESGCSAITYRFIWEGGDLGGGGGRDSIGRAGGGGRRRNGGFNFLSHGSE